MPADTDRLGATRMVLLGELVMILDLHRQGLSVSAIARRTGRDPKTIRKYIERGSSRRPTARVSPAARANSRPISIICASGSPPSPT